jgi:hypothetical protein
MLIRGLSILTPFDYILHEKEQNIFFLTMPAFLIALCQIFNK